MGKTRKESDELKGNPKMYTCFSCGLFHEKVECQGIWHCPNALCLGCGGGWFRRTLDSYKECDDRSGMHTVDKTEWLKKGMYYNFENDIDRARFYRTPREEPK